MQQAVHNHTRRAWWSRIVPLLLLVRAGPSSVYVPLSLLALAAPNTHTKKEKTRVGQELILNRLPSCGVEYLSSNIQRRQSGKQNPLSKIYEQGFFLYCC